MLRQAGMLIGGIVIMAGCLPSFGVGVGGGLNITLPPLEQIASPGAGDMLAFTRFDYTDFTSLDTALILLDDEHGVRDVYHTSGYLTPPVWSPDGTQLAFITYRPDGQGKLHVMQADAGTISEIGSGTFVDTPHWSPDGERIALFSSGLAPASGGGQSNVRVYTLADGGVVELPLAGAQDFVWLPGSDLLVLARNSSAWKAATLQPDGTSISEVPLTALSGAWYVVLSPDGTRVAFSLPASDPDALTDPLYVANWDGSDVVHVGDLWFDGSVVWSPDGSQLAAITLTPDYRMALYVVSADGSDRRQLMLLDEGDESGEIYPGVPAWSPDGTRIAIGSTIDPMNGSAIFVLNADGSGQQQITNASGGIYDLSWRPPTP
ncbi:MAG: PD40 domain-containing protein [Anaerolineae bacterium]|nr:PD40 domain-containing protein [Anaerolineae bacterium]